MQSLLKKNVSQVDPNENEVADATLRRRSVNIFMLLSVIVIAFLGILVGVQITRAARQQMIESYALSTATQVSGTVNSFVTIKDLQKPFRGQKYDDFYSRFAAATAGTNVVKVKLWRPDGTVVFSNDKEIVGKKFDGKEHLEEALLGKPSYEISDLKADENYRERSQFNRLLEMYYPVHLDENRPEKVSAVYEVYMSILPVEQHVNSLKRNLAIGLAGLVALLIIIAQIGARILWQRNDRLEELSAKLEQVEKTPYGWMDRS